MRNEKIAGAHAVVPIHGARWLSPILLLIIIGAVWAAFWPSMGGQFLNWDDDRNFVQNVSYRGLGLQQAHWAWSTYHLGVWQPLAWMLFGVEYALFGLHPAGYHATSILIHCVNALLFYVIILDILRLTKPKGEACNIAARLGATWAVLLFAVHPLRVEPVAWVSGQPYLPAALCVLLAIHVYLRGRTGRVWTLLMVFGLYLLGVGFKAAAISLPAVLLILDAWPLRRMRTAGELSRCLLEKIPFAVVATCVAVWAMNAKDFNASRIPMRQSDMGMRLAQASAGVWFYPLKTIIPTHLSAYYRLPDDLRLSTPRFAFAATCLAVAMGVIASLRRRAPAVYTGGLAYLVVLLPTVGVMQISQQLAADRYSYLAMMGPTALLAGLFNKLMGGAGRLGRALMMVVMAFAAGGLAHQTWKQTAAWHDSETLWASVLAHDPECAVAHCNLGEALTARGSFADASAHLSRAIDLDPGLYFAYSNLGVVFCQLRRFEDAIACGRRALEFQPGLGGLDLARTHAMLGQAYAGLRRDADAWRHTRMAQQLGLVESQKMIDYLSSLAREPAAGGPPR